MALSTRISPISRDVQVLLNETLSPQARSRALADFARAQLSEAEQINARETGRVPPHETFVDGRKGGDLDSVRPDGVIVFEFSLLDDLFTFVGDELIKHSPIRTGRYANSHHFFADGVEVEIGAPLPPAREYVFINSQPYARKVERWYAGDDGVYQAVAELAKRRFGNVAAIRFSYRALAGSAIMPYQPVGAPAGRNRKGQFTASGDRTAQKRERELRMPAIVIRTE